MRCAIFGCKTSNQGANACTKGFYSFPKKDKKLCDKWLCLSGRKDKVNTVHATDCVDHFREEDFKCNELYERYGLKYVKKLKPGVIPSLNLPLKSTNIVDNADSQQATMAGVSSNDDKEKTLSLIEIKKE